jgi:hypothetical protein
MIESVERFIRWGDGYLWKVTYKDGTWKLVNDAEKERLKS